MTPAGAVYQALKDTVMRDFARELLSADERQIFFGSAPIDTRAHRATRSQRRSLRARWILQKAASQ